jgi:hypothetical protein
VRPKFLPKSPVSQNDQAVKGDLLEKWPMLHVQKEVSFAQVKAKLAEHRVELLGLLAIQYTPSFLQPPVISAELWQTLKLAAEEAARRAHPAEPKPVEGIGGSLLSMLGRWVPSMFKRDGTGQASESESKEEGEGPPPVTVRSYSCVCDPVKHQALLAEAAFWEQKKQESGRGKIWKEVDEEGYIHGVVQDNAILLVDKNISAAPALSTAGGIVSMQVAHNEGSHDHMTDSRLAIGAVLMDGAGNEGGPDNTVVWEKSNAFSDETARFSNVVRIGKNLTSNGKAVTWNMIPGLEPDCTCKVRLNSRRELLFFVASSSGSFWLNLTPGGLKEGVSSLHLLTSCSNSDDDRSSGCYDIDDYVEGENHVDCGSGSLWLSGTEYFTSYFTVQLDIDNTDESIAEADRQFDAQVAITSAAQAENASCPLPLATSRLCELAVTDGSTDLSSPAAGFFHAKSQAACFVLGNGNVARVSADAGFVIGMCSGDLDLDIWDTYPNETIFSLTEDPLLFDSEDYTGEPRTNLTCISVEGDSLLQLRLSESGDSMQHKKESDDEWISTPLCEMLKGLSASAGLHLYIRSAGRAVRVQHTLAGPRMKKSAAGTQRRAGTIDE